MAVGWFMVVIEEGELVELSDGDLFPNRLDVHLRKLSANGEPSDAALSVYLRLQVKIGRPVPVSVAVIRGDGAELSNSDLRFPLSRTVDWVIGQEKKRVHQRLNPPPALADLGPVSLARHTEWGRARNALKASPKRRAVTEARLAEVAAIYRQDTSGKPTQAVADALHMSHSSAARWVGLAREHNYLPPSGRSRKGKTK
jgi:hypothetical protein